MSVPLTVTELPVEIKETL